MNKQEKVQRAKAILNEAKANNVIDAGKPLPEDETKLVKLADQLVELARKAHKNGERGDHVTSILFAADVDHNISSGPGEPIVMPEDADDKAYQEALAEAVENLPVPEEIEGDVPNLPMELADLSDKQLIRLHGAFTACSARIGWLHAIEEAGEAAAKMIADHKEAEYIATADRKDIGGKAKPQALLKAEAEKADYDLAKWRKRQTQHSIKANKFRRFLDVYNLACDRLSRQWTFRIEERNHS